MSDEQNEALGVQYVRIRYRTDTGRTKVVCKRVMAKSVGTSHRYVYLKNNCFLSLAECDATYYHCASDDKTQICSPVLSLQLLESKRSSNLWLRQEKADGTFALFKHIKPKAKSVQ